MILYNLLEPAFTTGDGRILKKKVNVLRSTPVENEQVFTFDSQVVFVEEIEGEEVPILTGIYAPRAVEQQVAGSMIVDSRTGIRKPLEEIPEEFRITEFGFIESLSDAKIREIQLVMEALGIPIIYKIEENEVGIIGYGKQRKAVYEIQVLQLEQNPKGIFK